MATFEIPTNKGMVTIQAGDKANAIRKASEAGNEVTLNTQLPSWATAPKNSGNIDSSTGTFTPETTTPIITGDNLKTTVPSMKISPQPTVNAGLNLGSEITSNINAEVQNQDAQDALALKTREEAQKTKTFAEKTRDAVSSFLSTRKGETALQDEANSTVNELGTTVDETAKILKETNAKINAIDVATNAQIQQIEKSFTGTLAGKQQALAEVQRDASIRKADLYIDKLMQQGDYDSAKAIADRKVDVQLENDRMTLDKLNFDYQENKELFTKSEQRQFELAQADRERAYEEKKTNLKTISDLSLDALQNGAPPLVASQMRNAKTVDEAIRIGGQYINALDRSYKQAQLNKLNAEIAEIGADPITNVDAGQYSGALSVILGSAKFTKDQKKSVINSINNGEDPFAVVKNQAKALLTGANQTKLESYEVARDTLADIGTQLQEFYDAGGSTGIFKGNFEKVVNKLGEVKDPKLVTLATQIMGNIQVYRNAISGTAYSEQEGRDITAIFPGINKSESLNNAILKGRSTLFDSVIDSTYRSVLGKNYDELKDANTAPATNANAGQTVKSNGKDYIVGQIYNDGTANWTIDANGKWTKVQ